MSGSEPLLGAFFVDIVPPSRTEVSFRCLAELADRAFTLADQQAGFDVTPSVSLGIKSRYASILYPVGNPDTEPCPIKAVLHQSTAAMHTQQVVIDFQTMTAECEGLPNLPIEPEQIEDARDEIKPHLVDVWRRKRAREKARQAQENLAWREFVERLETHDLFSAELSPDSDSLRIERRCPVCCWQTTACTSCHGILCLNRECAASHLVPFQSCSNHVSTATCLLCLDHAKGIPPLGQCPDCNKWFCQFELTWCLGRPKDPLDRSPRNHFRRIPNSARDHPTKPIGCGSCTGGQDRPHCSNGKCWSRVGGYISVCNSCSSGGGLWCACEHCWVCDDCMASPGNGFKQCPRCKRVYCVYECEYIRFCAECGGTTLCDDCFEEDGSYLEGEDGPDGVTLEAKCSAGHCVAVLCESCVEGTRCGGCRNTLCSSCLQLQRCDVCGGRFCTSCYRTRRRTCHSCDPGRKT